VDVKSLSPQDPIGGEDEVRAVSIGRGGACGADEQHVGDGGDVVDAVWCPNLA
jgi:hypothetical protein